MTTLAAPVLTAPVSVSPVAAPTAAVPASPVAPPPAARAVSNSDASVVIHFSPTINVHAADGDGAEAQLEKALQQFSGDLRRQVLQILRDANHDAHRRGYDNIGAA